AMSYLEAVCDLGPRPSGSDGMTKQQELLAEHFQTLGKTVERQAFSARHPQAGWLGKERVSMTNLIVRWRPELAERVLLCCHYDTRPLPDRDPNPRARLSGRFIGANDGGSGVAALMELGHHLNAIEAELPVGVDLVFFDGEEFVFSDRDPYFLGSTWFAMQYRDLQKKRNAPYRYRAGVLLDMVGDAQLTLYIEENSWWWRDTRPIVQAIWRKAAELGVKEFIARPKHEIRDDHVPLRNIGKIPTCDIIDAEYPDAYFGEPGSLWHTEADTPRHCSGESLAKVGWVVLEWLKDQPPATAGKDSS
ncbi:MAG: M28 family peptidase, partial [Planctomycetota bacterium]